MKKLKLLLVMVVVLPIVMMLTACGSNGNGGVIIPDPKGVAVHPWAPDVQDRLDRIKMTSNFQDNTFKVTVQATSDRPGDLGNADIYSKGSTYFIDGERSRGQKMLSVDGDVKGLWGDEIENSNNTHSDGAKLYNITNGYLDLIKSIFAKDTSNGTLFERMKNGIDVECYIDLPLGTQSYTMTFIMSETILPAVSLVQVRALTYQIVLTVANFGEGNIHDVLTQLDIYIAEQRVTRDTAGSNIDVNRNWEDKINSHIRIEQWDGDFAKVVPQAFIENGLIS